MKQNGMNLSEKDRQKINVFLNNIDASNSGMLIQELTRNHRDQFEKLLESIINKPVVDLVLSLLHTVTVDQNGEDNYSKQHSISRIIDKVDKYYEN